MRKKFYVIFRPLADDARLEIVRKVIAEVVDNYNKHNGESLEVNDEWARKYISFDMSNGVRDLQRQIQKDIYRMVKSRA